MTGDALPLTERDRALLAEVNRFGVISREQLVRLKFFSSKTRANERLRRLTNAGYLIANVQPLPAGGPRLVYSPGHLLETSRKARRQIPEASTLFVAHQLGLIDIRIAFEQHTKIERWLTERDIGAHSLGAIPDAYLEYTVEGLTYNAFIEYDRGTEPLGTIEQKLRTYLDLAFSGRFERTFKRRFFRALIVVDSAKRLSSISEAAARLSNKVIRLSLLNQLSAKGPVAAIWQRPGASSFESLTTT